jgi:hypothetical protein
MTEKEKRTIIFFFSGEMVKVLATFSSAFGGQLLAYPGG